MPEEDAAAIVRASFDAGSLAEGSSYWHDDVEYHEDPLWPGSGTYRGRESVVRRWEEYLDVLGPATEMSVQEVHDAGDALVALVRVRGTAPGSGAPHDHLWGYVVRVADGKLRYIRAFYDPHEALRAAGLGQLCRPDETVLATNAREKLLDPNLREHGVGVVAGSPFPGVADTGAAAFVEDLGACG